MIDNVLFVRLEKLSKIICTEKAQNEIKADINDMSAYLSEIDACNKNLSDISTSEIQPINNLRLDEEQEKNVFLEKGYIVVPKMH
jgi:Asp-tRNA(Asn)/Glu-tRNA(Gln) amidotransferase C subunit